jgi:hypothetical protein
VAVVVPGEPAAGVASIVIRSLGYADTVTSVEIAGAVP